MIPGDLVDGAHEGGVEGKARVVDELRVRWIWDTWRGVSGFGRRSPVAQTLTMVERRKKKVSKGVSELGLELQEWMRTIRTPGIAGKGERTAGVDACHAARCDAKKKRLAGEEAPV